MDRGESVRPYRQKSTLVAHGDAPGGERWPFYFAAGSTIAVFFSIAVSQILLGAALVALMLTRTRLRLPPVWIPLAAFIAGTVLSLAVSGHAAAGLPQIRKFYVLLTLPVMYSTVRRADDARRLVLCWAAAATASGAFGIAQFVRHAHDAGREGGTSYEYFLDHRITGFMSHWQTFGGELMIVLVMTAAFVMFSPHARGWVLRMAAASAALIGAAVILGYTRGIWLACLCAGVYLFAAWKPRLLPGVPVLAAVVLLANPAFVRARFFSGFEPRAGIDSNAHHIVCWRTGLEMIRAHPWFGLGPEMVGREFTDYVPADIPRPLPAGWYGHLHSLYIHYAAERGLATMLALVAALVKVLFDYARALRGLKPGTGDARFLLHGGIAVVLAVMVSGVFEVNLGDSEVLALFLAAVAVGYVGAAASVNTNVTAY